MRAFGNVGVADLAAGSAEAAGKALDPEKIAFRRALREGNQEGAIAAAEVDLDRRIASENLRHFQQLPRISRHNLGRGTGAIIGAHRGKMRRVKGTTNAQPAGAFRRTPSALS